MLLARYATATGIITSAWKGEPVELLDAQIPATDPGYAYLYDEDTAPVQYIPERYKVVAAALVAKTAITIVTDVTSFVANGVAACNITVDPAVEVTILGASAPGTPLTAANPTFTLRATTPRVYVLTIAAHVDYWAAPVVIRAVSDVLGSYTPGTLTIATEQYLLMVKRVRLTATQRITLAGTARLRIT